MSSHGNHRGCRNCAEEDKQRMLAEAHRRQQAAQWEQAQAQREREFRESYPTQVQGLPRQMAVAHNPYQGYRGRRTTTRRRKNRKYRKGTRRNKL